MVFPQQFLSKYFYTYRTLSKFGFLTKFSCHWQYVLFPLILTILSFRIVIKKLVCKLVCPDLKHFLYNFNFCSSYKSLTLSLMFRLTSILIFWLFIFHDYQSTRFVWVENSELFLIRGRDYRKEFVGSNYPLGSILRGILRCVPRFTNSEWV